MRKPFDDDLGARRDRQADILGFGQFHRMPHDAAGGVQLGLVGTETHAGDHEQHRVDAERSDDLARLALRPLGAWQSTSPVTPRHEVQSDARGRIELLAIAADVEPSRRRIGRDGDAAGPDKGTAVSRPERRHRQARQIDLVSAQHDLVDRSVLARDPDRGNSLLGDLAGRLPPSPGSRARDRARPRARSAACWRPACSRARARRADCSGTLSNRSAGDTRLRVAMKVMADSSSSGSTSPVIRSSEPCASTSASHSRRSSPTRAGVAQP